MTTDRAARFKQAAIAYAVYGIIYLAGALYLVSQGIGTRGMKGAGAALVWFVLGVLFIVVFPWLISRGARSRGSLWFTRILTLLVAYRAFEVGRVALAPKFRAVPLPGGGEIPMALGAGIFFLITLATAAMLARAAWASRR
jgi:hypothetical protein